MKSAIKKREFQKMVAADVMQRKVVTISEDATIEELGSLLASTRVLGVPVVDKQGKLVGVASVTDLVRQKEASAVVRDSAFYHDYYPEIDVWDTPPAPDLLQVRVKEIMSFPVIKVTATELLPDLARLMRKHHIHRLVVTDGDRILGLVTTMDILGAVS